MQCIHNNKRLIQSLQLVLHKESDIYHMVSIRYTKYHTGQEVKLDKFLDTEAYKYISAQKLYKLIFCTSGTSTQEERQRFKVRQDNKIPSR